MKFLPMLSNDEWEFNLSGVKTMWYRVCFGGVISERDTDFMRLRFTFQDENIRL